MRLNWVGSISSKEQDRNLRNVLLVDQVASFSEHCSKNGAFHVGFSVRASVQDRRQTWSLLRAADGWTLLGTEPRSVADSEQALAGRLLAAHPFGLRRPSFSTQLSGNDPDSRGGHPVQARQRPSPLPGGQAIRNRSPPILPGVIREIDIWRVANLMIQRYGEQAKANSDKRAEELAATGLVGPTLRIRCRGPIFLEEFKRIAQMN